MSIAHFVVGSSVGLRSGSYPDQDHARQVLADAEWPFEYQKRRAALGQHRLHHRDSKVGVEVARRSLHEVDGCD